ncbi:unnamed protein product [Didymodactylos carnosus]|uniref:Uncharacterized protein n=1 Tax=Didymodactylos carnosus TaxID=1234261 RepID=A0A815JKN7_9BILA|nr:unnamed protein product [Didymodactylos carnosus]CAF1383363.1 unnamed protein product [Didymodactylos carnosus]CAF3544713.1 unnamed protein product [Didymodactylos carnosus]CAF4278392.1 unnamed protein product [Didymodactylos carnosus]
MPNSLRWCKLCDKIDAKTKVKYLTIRSEVVENKLKCGYLYVNNCEFTGSLLEYTGSQNMLRQAFETTVQFNTTIA